MTWKNSPLLLAMEHVMCDRRISTALLFLGTAGLAVGCYVCLSFPGSLALGLSAIGISIVCFILAMTLPFYAGKLQSAHDGDLATAALRPEVKVTPVSLSAPEHSPPSEPSFIVTETVATPIAVTSLPAGIPEVSIASSLPHVPEPPDVNPEQLAPDLATLMQASLSDLLLAAMCKDSAAAHRLFTQALGHDSPALRKNPLEKSLEIPQESAVK